jgi:hypothetical protein
MSLEDNRDLGACGEECASRSVDKAHDTNLTMDGCQRGEMLSETWHELLGSYALDTLVKGEGVGESAAVVDPWSELLRRQGVKMVDLSGLATVHVSLSEGEMEQALQMMQEQVFEEDDQG